MITFIGQTTETGPIAFIPGVPARDMDLNEWNELMPDLQRLAFNSGLYAGVPQPLAPPPEPAKPGDSDQLVAEQVTQQVAEPIVTPAAQSADVGESTEQPAAQQVEQSADTETSEEVTP